MENYEQKYKEALKTIESLYNTVKYQSSTDTLLTSQTIEKAFQELKESEDEKIRKELIRYVKEWQKGYCIWNSDKDFCNAAIAWLEKQGEQSHCRGEVNDEALQQQLQIWFDKGKCSGRDEVIFHPEDFGLQKQGEQKTTDNAEPKFKIGDWITDGDYLWQITNIDRLDYTLKSQNGDVVEDDINYVDNAFHIWTIQDAKEGDVLVVGDEDGTAIAICGKNDKIGNNILYCAYDDENGFSINTPIALECLLYPATENQRDLLFQKMKEE